MGEKLKLIKKIWCDQKKKHTKKQKEINKKKKKTENNIIMKKYDTLLIVPNFTSSRVWNFSIHRKGKQK